MRSLLLAAAAFPLLPAPSLALTPDELLAVWDGQAQAMAGMPFPLPVERPGDGSATIAGVGPSGESITLRPQDDGSVRIEAPIPATQRVPLGDGPGEIEWRQEGLTLTARDGSAPGAVVYALAAPSLQVVTLPGAPLEAAAELSDALVEIEVPGGAGAGTLALTITAEGLAYLYATDEAGTGIAQSQSSRTEALALRYAITLPASLSFATLAAMADMPDEEVGRTMLQGLRDGLAIEVEASTGASSQTGSMTSPFLSYDVAIQGGPSVVSAAMSLAGITVDVTAQGASVQATSDQMPGPVNAMLGAAEASIDLPLTATPSPFTYRVSLSDVTLAEETWAAFDPQGALGRDPARLLVDLGGTVAMDAARLLEEGMMGMVPSEPPRIDGLEIRALEVAALGATATATGALTFDAAMTPSGSGTVTLTGSERVLSALESLGVVPPEALSQARSGLAMFFDPAGDDTLTTDVALGADGSVTVNGQQVQ